MEYQRKQISMQELPEFIKGLPEGFYVLYDKKAGVSVGSSCLIDKSINYYKKYNQVRLL